MITSRIPLVVALLVATTSLGNVGRSGAAGPVDYHAVRGRLPRDPAGGRFEGERHFELRSTARVQGMAHYDGGWSHNAHLLWDGKINDRLSTGFELRRGGKYRLHLRMTKAPDYGRFKLRINGRAVEDELDLYSPRVEPAARRDLGAWTFKAGRQALEFTLIGANQKAVKFRDRGYLLGLDYLQLTPLDPQPQTPPPRPEPPLEPDAAAGRTSPPATSLATIRPLLAKHCFGCHGDKQVEGELNLKQLTADRRLIHQINVVQRIVEMLAERKMPPADAPQPSPAVRRRLTDWFRAHRDASLKSSRTQPPVVMRRMNRYEYNNAVRDLLQLRGDIYPLPEKTIRADDTYFDPAVGELPRTVRVGNRTLGKFQVERQILTGVVPFAIDLQAEHGFNNRGGQLSLSPILLETFVTLGRAIVDSPQFDDYCRMTDSFFRPSSDDLTADQLRDLGRQRIEPFLRTAFRGPVTADTTARYTRFFDRELKRTGSFTRAMKSVVAGALASPRFLYLVEQQADVQGRDDRQPRAGATQDARQATSPVTDYELATRLSFFLWSSIPDKELLDEAAAARLRNPRTLRAQIERMLLDRRSQSLSENFARQWLRLDQLITAVPDLDRFPRYYSRIGCEQWKFGLQTMLEPLLLFESILVEDRSIMLLVDSNYAYRSDELQSWYQRGVPFGNKGNINRFGTFQQAFTRRKLKDRRQGGVMTTAAVLTMTSQPLRTSPIQRGAWVAAVLFNQPPAPPPDVVPEIEADDAEIEARGLTLRQRLKQHQTNQSCASCHAKIDPYGFALENFDPVGRWRDQYRSGLPIDASGKLDGKLPFTDVVGFKDAILAKPERFMRAFSEHLLAYALGRELTVSDRPAVDRIVRAAFADRGQLSTIITGVATSYPFLHKASQATLPRPESPPVKSPRPK